VEERRAQLAALADDDGRKLADAALAAAADAKDPAALAWWSAVAAALSPSDTADRRAREAGAALDGVRRIATRRFVTAGIDDLTITPAPLASGGKR
jgi:hypothetical protein